MNFIQKKLPIFTIGYLIIPYIIFILAWLKFYWSIPLLIATGVAIYFIYKNYNSKEKDELKIVWDYKTAINLAVALILLFLWVYFSGNGGFSFQNSDWYKHNAILHHLIYSGWPVRFDAIDNFQNSALVYYIAFYLPPALVGKIAGWTAANIFLFIWVYLGIILTYFWLIKLSRKTGFWLVLVLIAFGGLDILGNYLLNSKLVLGPESSEWWASLWQYSSNSTQLFWVPQQALAGWLIICMLTGEYLERKSNRNVILIFSLSILWSPLISIGLFPYAAICTFGDKFKKIFSIQNIIAMIYILILGLFFLANIKLPKTEPSTIAWLWQNHDLAKIWPQLLLFYAVEFFVFYICCIEQIIKSSWRERIWWIAAVLFLIFAPFFKFGLFNDFVMRSSIPSLFLIMILAIKVLAAEKMRIAKIALVMLLAISSLGTYSEVTRALANNHPDMEGASNLTLEVLDKSVISQYLGTQDSAFFKYLSR